MTVTLISIHWRLYFGHEQYFLWIGFTLAYCQCRWKCVRLQLMPLADYNAKNYLQCNSGPEAVHLLAYKEKRLQGRRSKETFFFFFTFILVLETFICSVFGEQSESDSPCIMWCLSELHFNATLTGFLSYWMPSIFWNAPRIIRLNKVYTAGWSNKLEVRASQCKVNFAEDWAIAHHWFSLYPLSMQRRWLWSTAFWRGYPYTTLSRQSIGYAQKIRLLLAFRELRP